MWHKCHFYVHFIDIKVEIQSNLVIFFPRGPTSKKHKRSENPNPILFLTSCPCGDFMFPAGSRKFKLWSIVLYTLNQIAACYKCLLQLPLWIVTFDWETHFGLRILDIRFLHFCFLWFIYLDYFPKTWPTCLIFSLTSLSLSKTSL